MHHDVFSSDDSDDEMVEVHRPDQFKMMRNVCLMDRYGSPGTPLKWTRVQGVKGFRVNNGGGHRCHPFQLAGTRMGLLMANAKSTLMLSVLILADGDADKVMQVKYWLSHHRTHVMETSTKSHDFQVVITPEWAEFTRGAGGDRVMFRLRTEALHRYEQFKEAKKVTMGYSPDRQPSFFDMCVESHVWDDDEVTLVAVDRAVRGAERAMHALMNMADPTDTTYVVAPSPRPRMKASLISEDRFLDASMIAMQDWVKDTSIYNQQLTGPDRVLQSMQANVCQLPAYLII